MNDSRTFYIAVALTMAFLLIAGPFGFFDWIEAHG